MSVDIVAVSIEARSHGIKEASQILGGLSTSAANTEKRILALIAATDKLQASSIASANAMNSHMAALQKQAALINSMATGSHAAAGSTQSLAAAMALLAASMNALNQSTQNANRSQQQHNQGMREAHALARGLSGSLGALWVTYGGAVAGMAAGLAIGASLKGILTVGKDVEHTLETIRVKGGETVESANQMREAIYSIGQGVYGPQEVVRALESLVLAGLTAKDAMQALRPALNLATAGGTDIGKAAEGLVTIGTAVGATAKHYTMLADGITMAANTSLASVESITNTVKRASVVNKLYGATFEDILIQASALANLGIKDTSAGTAITNFYGDMQGKSEKAKKALDELGVSFSDANGRAKPIVPLLKELNTALNAKFNGEGQKKWFMDVFQERSKRDIVALTDLVRSAGVETGKTGSKLEDLGQKIAGMAGVSSLAAAQISLTTENQIKSMSNTLRTTLAKTFTEMSPQVNIFTMKMKEAFNSPQFATALTTIASAAAALAVGFVNNIGPLAAFVAGIIGLKLAIMGMSIGSALTGPLMAAATAFGATTVAASGATVATGALGTAIRLLPFIGLAAGIATVVGALIMYKFHASGAKNQAIETAEAYRTNYLGALQDEAKQIKLTNDNLAAGLPLMEAQTRAIKEQALEKAKLNNQNAVTAAQTDLDNAKKGFDKAYGPEYLKMAEKNGKLPLQVVELTKELNKQKTAAVEFGKANDKLVGDIIAGSEKIRQAYLKEQKSAQDAADAAAKGGPRGTAPDKAAINDAYAAAIQKQDAEIRASKRALQAEEDKQNLKFRAGEIGKLQFIEEMGKQQVVAYERTQKAIAAKLQAAQGKKDKSEVQRYTSEQTQAEEDFNAKKSTNAQAVEAQITQYKATYTRLRITELEKEGKYEEAARMRFSSEHSAAYQQAEADSKKYGGVAQQVFEQLKATQAAAIKDGFNREAMNTFMDSVEAVRNSLKGVQTANEGGGLAAMFAAATAASKTYQDSLPDLRIKMADITDPAKLNEAQAQLINLAENQRKLWVGVGESISKSLGSAFGEGGKAAGNLIKIGVDYNNLEKKTGSARIKAYGDAAGAAKGFFKEGSTGYKVLEGAEKAFRLIELAGMAKSLAATIATAAAKAAAWVPAVFMSFMGSLGPWGMAAAGAAIASVLGGAFGGGGSAPSSGERQKTQGTGSVLGSPTIYGKNGELVLAGDKSESIVSSLNTLEKNSGLGLAQGNQMVNHLRVVADNIVGLASLIARATGITGKTAEDKVAFGGKGVALTGAVGGAVGGAALGTYLGMGFAAIGGPLGMALGAVIGGLLGGTFIGKALGKVFGGSVSVQDTGFTMASASLAAMKSSGVNASQFTDTKKDGGWFRSDKYNTDLKSLGTEANDQFTKIILGMSDAITAASTVLDMGGDGFNQRLQSFVIDIGKISLKGLTGDEIQSELEAVFSKLGDDMARFALTGLDKFQQVGEGYLETVVRVATNLMQVREVFAVLNKTFALTGTAAINVSESLIKAAGGLDKLTEGTKFYVDNFLTESERMEPITASVIKQLANLNIAEVRTIDLYKQKIRSLDLTNAADQRLYAAMLELAPAFKEAADYAQSLVDGTETLTDAQEKALKNIEKARSQLQDSYNAESSALQSTIDKTKAYVQTLKTFQDGLKLGADSPLTNMQKYAEARKQIVATTAKAKGGDQQAKDQFTSIAGAFLQASKVVNASGAGYGSDFNMVQTMIDELSISSQSQVDTATASLNALNAQVVGLIDINKSVISVAQAIINLQNAITAGTSAGLSPMRTGATAPTPGQVAAIGPQPSPIAIRDEAKMVDALGKVQGSIDSLREEQKVQTGALVGAAHEASDNSDTVEGLDKIGSLLYRVSKGKIALA